MFLHTQNLVYPICMDLWNYSSLLFPEIPGTKYFLQATAQWAENDMYHSGKMVTWAERVGSGKDENLGLGEEWARRRPPPTHPISVLGKLDDPRQATPLRLGLFIQQHHRQNTSLVKTVTLFFEDKSGLSI